jgi:hypothetical protein
MYAEKTNVSVATSRAEIESIVLKYGASRFATMTEDTRAVIMFEACERRVMFELPLPARDDFKKYQRNAGHGHMREVERTPLDAAKAWEQGCRQRWRALALVIKAKLEAVETGITTFEDEFLAHIILPDGKTVGKWFGAQLEAAYANNKMPLLLRLGDGL